MNQPLQQQLQRTFPALRGLSATALQEQAAVLGLFAARAWSAGPAGMAARGITLPHELMRQLSPAATQVARSGQGGAEFLTQLCRGLPDEASRAAVLVGLGRVFGEATRGPQGVAPPVHPAGGPAAAAPAGEAPLDLLPEGSPLQPQAAAPAASERVAPTPQPAPGLAPLELRPEGGSSRRIAATDHLQEELEAQAAEAEAAPQEPAARALWRYERSGALSDLSEAETILRAELERAPHATAAAQAEASLGRVALLRGDAEEARRLGEAALRRHPATPEGVEVLVRLARGEAELALFLRGLRQLGVSLAQEKQGEARALAEALSRAHAQEPLPWLALLVLSQRQGDSQGMVAQLEAAWERYPSQRFASYTLGGRVDAELVDLLVSYGRRPLDTMDPEGLRHTVEGIDDKKNLIAGSLRMAVGVARVALVQSSLPRAIQRRLHYGSGKALLGLQYFEAAPDEMGRALQLDASPSEARAINNDRIKAQALWRAFDSPGIKAQQRRYPCLGCSAFAQRLGEQLEAIRADRETREAELFRHGEKLAELGLKDRALQEELVSVAAYRGRPDPLEPLKNLEAELAKIAQERAQAGRAAPQETPAKGLFGKLKAAALDAASQVGDAAREAKHKLREAQLQARRGEVFKAFSLTLAREFSGQSWKHPFLTGFARRAGQLEAYVDYFEAEERRCSEQLKRLAELSG